MYLIYQNFTYFSLVYYIVAITKSNNEKDLPHSNLRIVRSNQHIFSVTYIATLPHTLSTLTSQLTAAMVSSKHCPSNNIYSVEVTCHLLFSVTATHVYESVAGVVSGAAAGKG